MELRNNKKLILVVVILLAIGLFSTSYFNKLKDAENSQNCNIATENQELKQQSENKETLFIGCNGFF